jgi:KEOPS complex subunit Cgi121
LAALGRETIRMDDPVASATEGLKVWLARVPEGEAVAKRDRIVSDAASAGIDVLVLRADRVFGSDHLRAALYHAKKAMIDGRNSSDSLAMETLLYASGERQLSVAIKKMSVDQASEEMAIAQLSRGALPEGEGWREMDPVRSDLPDSALEEFGVSKKELQTVIPGRRMDLILERTASVDVLKK